MMDLKEIIKWFLPCFHIILKKFNKMDCRLTVLCLFLFFNFCLGTEARVTSGINPKVNNTLNIDAKNINLSSVKHQYSTYSLENDLARGLDEIISGRTFGRPFKKMMASFLPIIFQVGAASTWAVVAAIVGFKTLMVSVIILKLLLIAGAAKFGALFATKGHGGHHGGGQKDIHLHIHGGHVGQSPHEEVYGAPWNRDSLDSLTAGSDNKPQVSTYSPQGGGQPLVGPHEVNTPYGHYVRVDRSVPTGRAREGVVRRKRS